MSVLVELAERHLDWPMPGYTHLQRAQPVYLSHHLLAYFWKFRRDLQRFKFCMTATDDLPLGAGALAGVNFDTSRMFVAQELGFGGIAENSLGRRVQPRLRARLPVRRRHLRHAPVPAGGRDRGVVERGVRLLRGGRPVRVRLEPHAPEEEPRRRRAAAGQGAAGGGAAGHAARRAARAAAHLQQGPPGGQGAALRRHRHHRAVPRAWPPRCSRASPSTASAWPPPRPTSCWPPPTSPTCWSSGACPSARRTASSAGVVRAAVERGKPLSELSRGRAGRARARARTRSSTSCCATGRGSSRRSPRAAPRCPGCATSSRRRATCWPRPSG